MTRVPLSIAAAIERFFQFAMLGLLATGYFALVGTGFLDRATLLITGFGVVFRALSIAGIRTIQLPGRFVAFAYLLAAGFFFLDLRGLGTELLAATIHLVCLLSVLKIISADSDTDYLYIGAIAFVELIAAAVLSSNAWFFAYLAVFLLCAIGALASAEIRRGFDRHEQTVPPRAARISWRLGLMTAVAAAGILTITAGFFLLLPRTARAAAMLFPNATHLTGFAGEINLGKFGEIGSDDRPVMHVQPFTKNLPPTLKWRGAAWSRFDGKRWWEPGAGGRDMSVASPAFVTVADELQRSRRDGPRVTYRVDVRNADAGVLFIAGIPEFLNVTARRLFRTAEGSFRVPVAPGEALRYEVSAQLAQPFNVPLPSRERARYLHLPALNTRIWSQAREWAGEGDAKTRASRIEQHLRNDFAYELRLPDTASADPLSDFLFVRKKGHCEYFASAMAVMLRTLGIPSRMASGFQSGYFNEVSGLYVIRGSDAHAWVEGYIDGTGWVTFDPTPSSRNAAARTGLMSRVDMYLDALDNGWQDWVVAYDPSRQMSIALRVETAVRSAIKDWKSPTGEWRDAMLGRAGFWGSWVVGIGLILLFAVFAGPGLWREIRGRFRVGRVLATPGNHRDASILYQRMLDVLAKRGYQKPSWFTPMEFARHLPVQEAPGVVEFTVAYNAARFGATTADRTRLGRLLDEITRGQKSSGGTSTRA